MEILKGTPVVKPSDRFEYWHQVTCRNFSLTESDLIADGHFQAQVSLRKFGSLLFSEICSSTSNELVRVTRTCNEIRRDSRDHFCLWLALEGKMTCTQGGREAHIVPGDLLLHDQGQPFTLEFGSQSHVLTITIPRMQMVTQVAAATRLTARAVSSNTKLGAFAQSVVRQLVGLEDDVNEELTMRIGSTAIELAASAVEAELTGQTKSISSQDRRLAQVKCYMMKNLYDPGLNLECIAARQNMAPRTLNRLFAREGTTPIRWLWRQRLAAAYRALKERRIERVTDAAFTFGFSDVAHFSRSFKATFGQTPEAVRRGHEL
jgi:AraC-like DNA-binding protein/mannose-6-phosphate isomerase-like protein (cupin superfamily)